MREEGKIRNDAFEEFPDLFFKLWIFLSFKIEFQIDLLVAFFFRPVFDCRLGIGIFQGKADGRISRELISVLPPVFDQCNVGWRSPAGFAFYIFKRIGHMKLKNTNANGLLNANSF